MLTSCGFISVAKFVTAYFQKPLNTMRNVNVIELKNSQLNKTAVMPSVFYTVLFLHRLS